MDDELYKFPQRKIFSTPFSAPRGAMEKGVLKILAAELSLYSSSSDPLAKQALATCKVAY